MQSVSLVNTSIDGAKLKYSHLENNKYLFEYPCERNDECTDYKVIFLPGVYKFELYGASGGSHINNASSYRFENNSCIDDQIVLKYGGNTACQKVSSNGGAGGYISGKIKLKKLTATFLTIGGQGIFSHNSICYWDDACFNIEHLIKGGCGGGGSSSDYCVDSNTVDCGSGSGGGQTAVKFIENDLWHRVLVSGGGGGSDDKNGEFAKTDDGSGGSGGNLTAQSWFVDGILHDEYIAFGSGEAARLGKSKNPNAVQINGSLDIAGAGGGSSWALTSDAIIPQGLINASEMFYENIISKEYAFTKHSGYLFEDVIHVPGIWNGHGKIIITILDSYECQTCLNCIKMKINFNSFILLIEVKS
ncbi:hypothetical protein TVAG_429280 [Trichomonas vaginalis G3]|uniref:receptor protein-tyrosine kinase n=1 Tax=Trichomonas vaginalis (strain ATCC PRA-98 / G3) TaxID=412133 RepID=A2F946_TRIV3|nr:glycine-rich protein family [Trichomonas vaginalis G3]EAX98574.1 hypothetical protein TVAG_429280 [Trichomonas vaginalis G3]KAI5505227.1 glycine-rich protein family [Trichomonas vaginalis G3]|eukprot:XP_001311504.1 hypothetical protein [Trichomonas vaginalis G3]